MFSKSTPKNEQIYLTKAAERMVCFWFFLGFFSPYIFFPNSPVSSLSSRKNFWLKIKATPLISSTLASAVVFLLTKLAVMAMANFPRNSLRAKPAQFGVGGGGWREIGTVQINSIVKRFFNLFSNVYNSKGLGFYFVF